jgi:hypothetical protein
MFVSSINDETIAAAEALGAEHGRNAGSWVTDGNTTPETYRRLLEGIRDGDPEILDALPCAPLSGEWAGDPTPASVLAELDVAEDDDDADDVLSAYEDAYRSAVVDEVERACLEQAEPDVWELCDAPPAGCEAVADLYHWSTNHDPGRGPFSLFADLIGWSDDELGAPIYNLADTSLGYLELGKLAAALAEYADDPHDVRAFVGKLIAAECRD